MQEYNGKESRSFFNFGHLHILLESSTVFHVPCAVDLEKHSILLCEQRKYLLWFGLVLGAGADVSVPSENERRGKRERTDRLMQIYLKMRWGRMSFSSSHFFGLEWYSGAGWSNIPFDYAILHFKKTILGICKIAL